MDLFQHKVLITALFSCINIPVNGCRCFLDLFAINIIKMYILSGKTCNLFILHIIYTSGVFQDSRHIGGDVGGSLLHTQDHRAVLTCHIDFPRIVPEHNSQCVGAADADHGVVDGIYRCAQIFFVIIVYQLDCYLCVCRGIELIALANKLILQLLVVLDDSVVDSYYIAVITHMGMGVNLRGFSVGGPSGMSDSTGTGYGFSIVGFLCQNLQSAFCFDDFCIFVAVTDCYSC